MNEQVELSNLEFLARKYANKLIPTEEIEKNNITKELFDDIEYAIKNKRLINIQIIGTVVKGKSTVMCKIVNDINNRLGKTMGIDKICTDQIEFSRKTNSNTTNTCYGIDEWNSMSSGGLNSSTEQQYLDWFSDVCAQRFIHRVSCSPKKVIDQNSDTILEILERNNKKYYTRVLVYHRLSGINNITQLVGHADINIKSIIHTNWYEQYRQKKFKKMELINQHGARDDRDREFAELVILIYEKLEPLAEQTLVGVDIISGHIEVGRKQRQLSIYTGLDLEKKIHGILRIRTQIARTEKTCKKIMQQMQEARSLNPMGKNKIKDNYIKQLGDSLFAFQRGNEQNREILGQLLNEWKTKIKLNQQLQEIENKTTIQIEATK